MSRAIAALLAATLAGCGGETTVVTDAPAPAPTYQPAPARPAPAPRPPRRDRRPVPPPAAPLLVRDAPAEPAPAPAEPAEAPEEKPVVVRDDAYFEKLWAELPAPVAPLPPPLEPLPDEKIRGLRTELRAYLREQAGRHRLPKTKPKAGVPVNFWPHVDQYSAFQGEYQKHKPELHGMMERDLWLAEKLLEQDDRAVRDSGLGLVRWAIICAAQYIKDGRLAVAVAEVYLVPHLDATEAGAGGIVGFVGRESLLRSAVTAFEAGKSWDRMAQACGDIVRMLPHNRNQSDAWRAKLAIALQAQDRRDEATAVLGDIQAPGVTALRDHYLTSDTDADQDIPAVAPEDAEE